MAQVWNGPGVMDTKERLDTPHRSKTGPFSLIPRKLKKRCLFHQTTNKYDSGEVLCEIFFLMIQFCVSCLRIGLHLKVHLDHCLRMYRTAVAETYTIKQRRHTWKAILSWKGQILIEGEGGEDTQCNVSTELHIYIYIYIYIWKRKILMGKRGCPRGVRVNAMDCGIVVCEFVLYSSHAITFTFGQIPLAKLWTPLSSQLWVK